MRQIRIFRITVLFFGLVLNVFSQNNLEKQPKNAEQYYEDEKYAEVVKLLAEKYKIDTLNFEEYFMLTRSYGRTGQYSNGLVFAEEMQGLAMKSKDTLKILRAANLVAENFVDLGEIEEGLKESARMLTYFREKDSVQFQSYCFKLGMLYYKNNEYQKAYETYNKITRPAYRNLSIFYNNYALTLMGVKKWDEALVCLKKSLKLSQESGSINVNKELSNIATVYMNQKKWDRAKIFLDSASNFIANNEDRYSKQRGLEAFKNLSKQYFSLYKHQGKIDEASLMLDHIESLNQELFQMHLGGGFYALDASNEREYNLKKEVKIIDDQLELSQKQKLWGAVIFLFVIIGLLSFLFLYKYRSISAAHENVVTEQRLLRSQMNPHFIFNSLSVLQGMILNKEDKKAVKYVSKFSKLLRLILESSREKMVPIQEELDAIKNYVDLQNMGRQVPFKYTLSLNEKIEDEELLIPPMLIQPFVENSIEHGFKNGVEDAEITIAINFEDEKLFCEIKDNGVGLNLSTEKSSKNKNSLATKITSERLKIISKQYKVESNVLIQDRSVYNEQGTQVLLTLPYKTDENA